MRTLFIMILGTVYILGQLIAPDLFSKTSLNEILDNTSLIDENAYIGENTFNPIDTVVIATTVPSSANPTAAVVSPTSVPDLSVTDPQVIFGVPKVEDTFERGSSGFGLSAGLNDDENIRIIALNKKLSLEPKKNNGWISWRLRPPTVNDAAVQMKFSIITCARGDRLGIMMHSPDYTNGHGYYFSLSCEGTASILRDNTVLDTADATGAFLNNSGDINVLTSIIRGNNLTIDLNGVNLLTVQDEAYKEGFSGFFTAPQGQNTLTMDVISFAEYYNE